MLATRLLSPEFRHWNAQQGAPFGKPIIAERWLKRLLPANTLLKLRGPFSIQSNNTIRTFEYPWAWFAAPVTEGMRMLDIGGGLGGFQFALASAGCKVVNVDPGLGARGVGWHCDQATIKRLNRVFKTDVELRNTVVQDAGLEDESLDRAYSISVLEHLPADEIVEVLRHVYRVLKPGGLFVLTVDLFLELQPFTNKTENRWGTNVNVRSLTTAMPFNLVQGERQYLYGFDEFSSENVLSNLSEFMVGAYPALAQCLVLQKPV